MTTALTRNASSRAPSRAPYLRGTRKASLGGAPLAKPAAEAPRCVAPTESVGLAIGCNVPMDATICIDTTRGREASAVLFRGKCIDKWLSDGLFGHGLYAEGGVSEHGVKETR